MFSPYMYFSHNPIINILIVISLVISLWASYNVKNTIKKNINNDISQLTGYELCIKMLKDNNIHDVKIEQGNFALGGEYYDPSRKTIVLSQEAINSNSVSATAITAHEVGHAIQHNTNYFFGKLRTSLVKPVNFISKISMYVFIFSIFATFMFHAFNFSIIIYISAIGILGTLLFQIVTLPVEFDASNRALAYIENINLYDSFNNDITPAKKVLFAAALTYLAATLSTFVELLRLLSFLSNND